MSNRPIYKTAPKALTILFVATISVCALSSVVSARTLDKGDLREFGFSGVYRGTVRGVTGIFNFGTNQFDLFPVNRAYSERIPAKPSTRVLGPTNASSFTLTHFPATGNERRILIRARYSGTAFNTFFGANTQATGSKILRIRKIGEGSGARYVMAYVDNISEFGPTGALRAYWRVRGSLVR